MNIAQFKRLEELFDAAVELPADQRHAYLEQACGEDAELLGLIERMLDRAGDGTAVLRPDIGALIGETDTLDTPASQTPEVVPALGPGDRVGHYVIREQIGEGGFATVYAAEQEQPVQRRVALKIIKLGMDTRQVIARFEAERQALAMMDHPNVAKVFDAGATDTGRPYFVMEHVPGVSITEHCDRQRLNIQERLNLFMQVCDAARRRRRYERSSRGTRPLCGTTSRRR